MKTENLRVMIIIFVYAVLLLAFGVLIIHTLDRVDHNVRTTTALVESTIGHLTDGLITAREDVKELKDQLLLMQVETNRLLADNRRLRETLTEAKMRLREYISMVVEE